MAHLFLFFTCLVCLPSQAQSIQNHPEILDAYHDILKLKLESGRATLNQVIPNQAQLGHYHYVKSLADVIEILITEDPSLYKKYEDSEEDHLNGLEEMDENDPYYRYYNAEIRIQWAIVKIMFEEDMKAGLSLKAAYSYVEKNIEKFPDFTTNYKSYGSLHVLFAVVPESYHWILKLFGIKANAVLGWSELNKIQPDNPYWLETGLIKSLIAINILNKEEQTMTLLNELRAAHTDNLIVNYLYNTALIKYAKSEQALPNLRKLLFASSDYLHIDNVYYKLGDIYMQKQQYPLARYHLSKFINQYKGKNYVKDTWFKIFLSYWLEGNEKMAEIHWNKAKNTGRTFAAADKNASSMLNEGSFPNPLLMKARLATDGGYFDLATQALKKIQQGSLIDKKEESEYFYRYGRLDDKMNKEEEAIFNYLNAIKKSGKENWYYAPSACLYTGYIYEARRDYEKAQFYYEKAMSYKKHPYKVGIDHKAYAALALLQEKQK
ncbi:hypothetical protein N7E81_17595 [Reichenbachiella carrageenanivorans]|uniref:Tetratricopeptide repeat-containing protein n=1 Tax=Reichenbachiella carrageenanivorans TaxID=2979869 RepID=A0ABY6D0M0_9BACT|nr:hypothetical protein [Reichenbachiella carrageenanivorans]UXX79170.1 hypothetical protein N7E81_17595 [Reichenbachiella carrageenanivorans]